MITLTRGLKNKGISGSNSGSSQKGSSRKRHFQDEVSSESYSESDSDLSDGDSDWSIYVGHSAEGADEGGPNLEDWRFDPLSAVSRRAWKLTDGQSPFVAKYLEILLGRRLLRKRSLKSSLDQTNSRLKCPKLDNDVVDLIPFDAKGPIRTVYASFQRVHGRLLDTMAPGETMGHPR